MKKKALMLMCVFLLITGCSNNKQLTVGSAIGGTAGALAGGMTGAMLGLLASGGNPDTSDAIVGTGLILGAISGGAVGAVLGGGLQSVIEK